MSENLLFGLHAVAGAVEAGDPVSEVWLSRRDGKTAGLVRAAREKGIRITQLSPDEMEQRFRGKVHQGVACRLDHVEYADESALIRIIDEKTDPLFLVLDQIQDPRNFGACLRTAEAAGVDAVIFPKDRSSELTPVAAKTAAGAGSRLTLVRVTNIAQCLKMLKERNVWLTGAEGESSTTVYQVDFRGACAIVVGNEGKGIRRLTRDACDFLASIPMAGGAESLNVSVATGVILFEAVRQRRRSVSSHG